MRLALSLLTTILLATPALADKAVRGHTKKDGTVVKPHHRTEANTTQTDNHTTKGNTNPHTGKRGTKIPKR